MMVIYDFWTPVFFAEKGKFVTIVCQEKPFNGAMLISTASYLKHIIVVPMFQFVINFVKFQHEINILKCILYKNSYPRDFVDKYIKAWFLRYC